MRPEEKKDLALFDRAARRRVADEAGCTTSQVDDCIARFLWTRQMTRCAPCCIVGAVCGSLPCWLRSTH